LIINIHLLFFVICSLEKLGANRFNAGMGHEDTISCGVFPECHDGVDLGAVEQIPGLKFTGIFFLGYPFYD
jgi:hypothetical protein